MWTITTMSKKKILHSYFTLVVTGFYIDPRYGELEERNFT